jgi:hypothetical protein
MPGMDGLELQRLPANADYRIHIFSSPGTRVTMSKEGRHARVRDLGDPYRNSPYLEGVPWPDLPTQQTVVTSDLVEFP